MLYQKKSLDLFDHLKKMLVFFLFFYYLFSSSFILSNTIEKTNLIAQDKKPYAIACPEFLYDSSTNSQLIEKFQNFFKNYKQPIEVKTIQYDCFEI